jgi:hypothetical protein
MTRRTTLGDFLWISFLVIITAFLILPNTRQTFIQLTGRFPYGMGFVKFAILATLGELLALRLAKQTWVKPLGLIFKVIVWGLIGVLITYMFSFYSAGVSAMVGTSRLIAGSGFLETLVPAFITSLIMNLTFGIVFMALHRLTDRYIEMRVSNLKPSLNELVEAIDWDGFIKFVVLKTIPLFWIPAHTVTFSLPPHFRVIVAAYHSIILGVILVSAAGKQQHKA